MADAQSNPSVAEGQSADAHRSETLGCARAGPSTSLGTNGEAVSRRALLGAAAGLPLLPRHCERSEASQAVGGLPRPPAQGRGPRNDGGVWAEALADYRAAEAEVRGFEVRNAGRPFVAEDPLDEVYGALGDVLYDALRRLLKVPAPDVGAVAVKLGLVVEHEVGTLSGGEACLEAIREDALRLSSERARAV